MNYCVYSQMRRTEELSSLLPLLGVFTEFELSQKLNESSSQRWHHVRRIASRQTTNDVHREGANGEHFVVEDNKEWAEDVRLWMKKRKTEQTFLSVQQPGNKEMCHNLDVLEVS